MKMNYTIDQQDLINFKKRKLVRDITSRAIRDGTLVRPEKCEYCGCNGKIEAHHRDYGKPLEVIWVCRKCHGAFHEDSHEHNPDNVQQTPLPACVDQYDSVQVTLSLPVAVFLNLHTHSKKLGVRINDLIKKELFKTYDKEPNQLKLKFMEDDINDYALPLKIQGIQSMGQNQSGLQRPRKRNVPRMEKLHHIFERNGEYARRV